MKTLSLIELLEPRIAPAALLSPTKVRYTDADGDIVTVKFSKGTVDLLQDFTFVPAGRGEQLQRISLGGDAAFSGADLTIAVARATTGDGVAHIGAIDASGVDLGTVLIPGDLGRIDAGDADVATAGVGFLKVRSLGRFGVGTQAADDPGLASQIMGDLGALKVGGKVKDASVSVAGDVGEIVIRGSLLGGAGDDTGMIRSTGGIGFIQIDGGIIGAAGQNSGAIISDGSLGMLIVGGSVQSGGGAESGSVRVGEKIGSILVRGSLLGNSAQPVLLSAGGVLPTGAGDDAVDLGRVRVFGDVMFAQVMAGYRPSAGAINGDAQIGRIVVDGNWVASTAVAGATAGPDGLFGTVDDAIQFPHADAIIASIATIRIAGNARGTKGSTTDHFGFVAEEIGEVMIGRKISKLLPGRSNDDDPAASQLAIGATGDFRIMEVSPLAPPPNLLAAVSRKIHGAAGAFDIDLLAEETGIESRAGDTLTLVFTFDHDLAGGTANLASGIGTVNGAPAFDGNRMTVNFSNVTDVQTLVVNLSGITDTAGGVLEAAAVSIGILQGDVTKSRAVNTSDVNTVRAATVPGTIDAANFRTDVDLSGAVDAADVAATRASSGHQLD